MKLTTEELAWIKERLKWYDIKFQEIYNEIADHIITGIEVARAEGDERDIANVFQTVVDTHFGGYQGIDAVVATHKKAFQDRMKKTMRVNFRYFINWETTLMLIVLVIAGLYLPQNKPTLVVILAGLFVAAMFPLVYAFAYSLKIKREKGKQSMVIGYMLNRSYLLVWFLYCVSQSINWAKTSDSEFWRPIFNSPVVYMVLFYLFTIYGLSFVKLCRQAFKLAS